MSAAGHHPNSHDDDADHGHEPGDDFGHPPPPPADEPQSPAWLPLLGGALFLAALLAFLVTRSPEADEPVEAEPAPAESASAAPDEAAAAPAPDPHAGHNH